MLAFLRKSRAITAETGSEIVIPDDEMIATYLKNPLFKHRVREVAAHTNKGYEGGFALYRGKGASYILSKAVLPDPSWWLYTTRIRYFSPEEQEGWNPSRRFPGYILTNYYRPGIKPVNTEQDSYWRQDPSAYEGTRNDLSFLLHSHPNRVLVPSMGDVGHWSAIERHNPLFVDSVLISGISLTKLLMWRRNTATRYCPPSTYYQGIDWVEEDFYQNEYSSWPKNFPEDFVDYAQDVGINAVVTTYNLYSNQFYPGASVLAERLTQ